MDLHDEAKMADVIPAGETLRMLRDRILLEPLDWEPSKILEVVRKGRPVRGVVKAVGPGSNPKKYKRDENGQRKSFVYSKTYVKTQVKPGDVVNLGGLNIYDGAGYKFDQVMLDGKMHLICQEADVACIESSS
jgi:hypothetical protein